LASLALPVANVRRDHLIQSLEPAIATKDLVVARLMNNSLKSQLE
jgi:hypothetical protein